MAAGTRNNVELLSPAGNWDCARAAVENGADAIYFGLAAGFNARARAENFSLGDLPKLMEYLHLRGVRGYVTLNTLVFSDELESVQQHAIAMAQAGVDAVLVQDLGAARLIRSVCPDLELHGSTQMTLSSSSGMRAAAELGLSRVVLPRELSIGEIDTITSELADNTNTPDSPVEMEAFVHGALCVAYSGQCLTSESLGGRSANRGQCAQACRLPYEVICDGKDVELGDVKYLLSPQDLAAHAQIPDMLAAGICSFKIEGRLKTPEYVANVTRHYRLALDAAIAEKEFALTAEQVEELELSFSRGFSPGWLNGCDHKMLVPGLSSAKRGVRIGVVRTISGHRVVVNLDGRLRAGDGVVFEGDRAAGEEQGGRVFTLYQNGQRQREAVTGGIVELEFHGDSFQTESVHAGQVVWKTDDPQLTRRLRSTYSHADSQRRVAVDLKVSASEGKPLRVVATAENGRKCEVVSDDPLPVATKHPVTREVLQDKLGRLGATVYDLRKLTLNVSGQPMTPHSLLGSVRKKLIEGLETASPPQPTIHAGSLAKLRDGIDRTGVEQGAPGSTLHVMCKRLEQLEPAIDAGATSLYVEFADIREYRQAVEIGRARNVRLYLATPRIEKPGEIGIFAAMAKHGADGILVRNLGGLRFFRERNVACVADFSFNAANELTVEQLKSWGAERVTASYDLNRDQMMDLVAVAAVGELEVVIHQHMPMFHMEHCVFCAVLSPGTNKTNCGRPCDDHLVQLRDRVGAEHPLHADVGCRNTLYNAVPQSAAEMVGPLVGRGVRHFRLELLESPPVEVAEIVGAYQRLLLGELSGQEVWQRLRATNRVGVTRGTMEAGRDPLAIL